MLRSVASASEMKVVRRLSKDPTKPFGCRWISSSSSTSSSASSFSRSSQWRPEETKQQQRQARRQLPRARALSTTTTKATTTTTSSFSTSNRVHHHTPNGLRHNNDDHNDRLLVIGSGVAGSAAALIAAELYQIPVTMIYAGKQATDCNSYWAQGGIIYRNYQPQSQDSARLLAQDIHRAGAGLCDADAVHKVAVEGPDRVRQLLLNGSLSDYDSDDAATTAAQPREPYHYSQHNQQDPRFRYPTSASSSSSPVFANVPFERQASTGELALCLEASHAAPRILYKGDSTGRLITQHITDAVARHPLITQLPQTVVTDLLVLPDSSSSSPHCVGVQTLHRTTGQTHTLHGYRGTVLASGGLAGIYEHSTNPPGFNALGSSVALALRHGVAVQDLEYVQFHPTALYIPHQARFLLTEALRGEGAVLRDASGRPFARDYHPQGELAPRDIVARAVFEEAQKGVADSKAGNAGSLKSTTSTLPQFEHNAFLDISHREAAWLHQRFPSIQKHIAQWGLDLGRDPLPVTPAAHYTCGGVTTNLQGQTNLPGLLAAGEAARTGLHGGNRLASTSLLEGLVFGASVADFCGSHQGHELRERARQAVTATNSNATEIRSYPQSTANAPQHQRLNGTTTMDPLHMENVAHRAMTMLQEVRRIMWDHVGVVRTPQGLQTASEELRAIREEMDHLHASCPTLETSAVRDAAYAGTAVAEAASDNPVSAGTHYIVSDDVEEEEDEEATMMMAAAAR